MLIKLFSIIKQIVFTWAGTIIHSIVQTDAAKSCVKSATLNNITSGGPFTASKTLINPVKTAGNMWYMCGLCGVPGRYIWYGYRFPSTTRSISSTPIGNVVHNHGQEATQFLKIIITICYAIILFKL